MIRAPLMFRLLAAALACWALTPSPKALAQAVEPQGPPLYRVAPMPRSPADLRKQFTPAQISILEKLNRRDGDHMLRAEPAVPGLIVPASWPADGAAAAGVLEDDLSYSPMPATSAWAQPHGKALVVHQPSQVFGAYENGTLVRWGPVSTGRKETTTPPGAYNLTWRAKGRHSTDNAAWFLPWYFNFHNERGVSFHQFDLPGYPASHACVRLLERDAKWLYEWGEQWTLDPADRRRIVTPGSAVLIVGVYDYAAPPPWIDPVFASRIVQIPER